MNAKYFTVLLTIISGYLLLPSCSDATSEGPSAMQSRVDPDSIRDWLAGSIDKAAKAEAGGQLDTTIFAYATAGSLYAQIERHDSMYLMARKIFMLCHRQNTYEKAIPYLTSLSSTLPARDTTWAKMMQLQGYVHYRENQLEESLEFYKQSASIWEANGNSTQLQKDYTMQGILYTMLADYPLAESIYENAIVLSRQANDTLLLKKHYFNLGKSKSAQGDWQAALQNYDRGQALVPHEDGFYEALTAEAYVDGGQAQKALSFALTALQKNSSYEGRGKLTLPDAYNTVASAYATLGKYDQAVRYYQKGLDEALAYYPPHHRAIGKTRIFLGDVYLEQGLWNLALQEYQEAIKVFLPGFQPISVHSCPSADSLLTREVWLMEALRNKGKTYLRKYEADQEQESLENAATHFLTAVRFISQIKIYYTESEAKFFLGNYAIPFIEDGIEAQLRLYQLTQNPKYQEAAFELAQQANAFLLRESINEQRAMQAAQVPADTIARLRALSSAIAETQTVRSEVVATTEQDSLLQQLFRLKQKRLNLLEALEQDHPKYFQLKHSLQPIPLGQIQESMDSASLAVQYFLGAGSLYTFAISRQEFHAFSSPVDSSFYLHIRHFRKTLSDLDYLRVKPEEAERLFLESSHALYRLLLDSVLSISADKALHRLIIIPDGILNYLSFECLLSEETDSWLEKDKYLINDFAIRYAYYAGLLINEEEQAGGPKSRFIGFGTEYNDQTLGRLNVISQDSVVNKLVNDALRGKKMGKLMYADDEVKEIADFLSGKAFLNKEATKSNFLENVSGYEAIHIATHGFIDTENDSTAFIVFNEEENSEDFLLSLPEIYGLQLNADLVALSACQTGAGALQRSEGIMSLARAFQFAGSNSLIASQWSLSDRASSLIMKSFYEKLNEGLPKSEALRQAKLSYLTDDAISSPVYRIPAYWGAIVLIGEDSPLEFESAGTNGWWIALGGILLLLIAVVAYRNLT